MSIVQQGPTPDASAAVRGLVNIGSQTFEGVKTFNKKIVIATVAAGSNFLEIPDDTILSFQNSHYMRFTHNASFGGWVQSDTIYRTENANGFWIGGVNIGLSSTGISAGAQSYSADLTQAQAAQQLSIRCAKGGSAGVAMKIGTSNATPHADAEVLRVGYNLGANQGSDGTPIAKFMGDARMISGAPATAPTDANLMASSVSFYLDEAGANLKVRVKYANGSTLKTATIALV